MVTGIELVFFIYGLAFFSMGLVLFLESGRSPFLAEGKVLIPLATFGLIHGFHEWIEFSIMSGNQLVAVDPEWAGWIRLFLLVFSFSLLISFGVQVLFTSKNKINFTIIIPAGVVVVFGFGVFFDQQFQLHLSGEVLVHIDIFTRYFLGVTGAFLAGLALLLQGKRSRIVHRKDFVITLWIASASFVIYGLTQTIVSPQNYFPANILNTTNFILMLGFPVQVIRALLAIVITISLFRAVQLADSERRAHYAAVQQDRLETLEQLKDELERRETLRQELMQHIVLAQEAERTRIARELHDETAQLLTAFNLHLASLRDSTGMDHSSSGQIRQLRSLTDRMAQSVYRMIHDLRPAQLDDLGLVPALEYLRDAMLKNYGLIVRFTVSGQRQRLDNLVETVIFRVAQEAITNVVRHAGVHEANLQLIFEEDKIHLKVHDDGIGFDLSEISVSKGAFGLAGMRERVETVGGFFQIETSPGMGCLITVTIPGMVNKPIDLFSNFNNIESENGLVEKYERMNP